MINLARFRSRGFELGFFSLLVRSSFPMSISPTIFCYKSVTKFSQTCIQCGNVNSVLGSDRSAGGARLMRGIFLDPWLSGIFRGPSGYEGRL
jgi:hypothetical protein